MGPDDSAQVEAPACSMTFGPCSIRRSSPGWGYRDLSIGGLAQSAPNSGHDVGRRVRPRPGHPVYPVEHALEPGEDAVAVRALVNVSLEARSCAG